MGGASAGWLAAGGEACAAGMQSSRINRLVTIDTTPDMTQGVIRAGPVRVAEGVCAR